MSFLISSGISVEEYYHSVSMVGTNAIAGSNSGLLYSSNSGVSWSQSNITFPVRSVFMVGTNAICIYTQELTFSNNIMYSSDSGVTWYQSNDVNGGWIDANFNSIYMIGANAIACSDDSGVWYSIDSGVTWSQSSNGDYMSICMIGTNAITGVSSNGLQYSSDSGLTWTQSNKTTDNFKSVSMVGTNAIAGSLSDTGLWYSSDLGVNWYQSNKTNEYFYSVSMVGTNAIAGTASNAGLWYSSDSGHTWTQSNKTDGVFMTVSMVGTNALAGSSQGVWYSSNSGQTWTQTTITNSINNVFMGSNGNNIIVGQGIIAYNNIPVSLYPQYLNYLLVDPSGNTYSGPTISNTSIISKFSVFSDLNPVKVVQAMAQYNTNTWTAQYYYNTSNSEYLELLTVDASGNALDALVIQTDTSTNANGVITSATKTYNVYDIEPNSIIQINKYSITYQTSNITQITGSNPIGTDSSGNTIYGFLLDASGNANYNIPYAYILDTYKVDASSNWILDASGSSILQTSMYATNQSLHIPFKNFIFGGPGNTNLLNFDMLFKLNLTNNPTYPIIKVTNFDNNPKYLAVTIDSTGNPIIGPNALKFSEIDTFYYDTSGNLLDTSGNIINPDSLVTATAGGYLVFNNNANDTGTPTGASPYATLQVLNPQSNSWVSTPVMIYNYGYLDYVYNPVTQQIEVDGPIIIQLSTVVIEVDDTSVDSCCMQINNMINSISNSTFNIGKLSDYEPLIAEVNAYTSNLNAAKITLNIDQVSSLEAYAANIQSMTNLFGQLVIQLNSSSTVDSEGICIRIKTALTSIFEGLQAMKSFKLAISQQNLLKVSQCLLGMSSKLNSLYGSITYTGIQLVGISPTTYVVNSSSFGPLFNLQESIWYFANGMPVNTALDINNNVYYRTWSTETYYVPSSYYTSKFALNANDSADLVAAYTLVHTLNEKSADNINAVLASPDVKNLQSSLALFSTYSNNLNSARNNLIYRLGQVGFKMTFDPHFN